jgi:hypothetical protein
MSTLQRGASSRREFAEDGSVMKARLWTAANVLMLLMFVFSAIVQYNDPDPYVWIPVYGAAAVACGLELSHRLRWWLPAMIGVGTVVWAATIAPHVFGRVPFLEMFSAWEMKNEGVEESREMYGLLIVALWMVVLAVADVKSRRAFSAKSAAFRSSRSDARDRGRQSDIHRAGEP